MYDVTLWFDPRGLASWTGPWKTGEPSWCERGPEVKLAQRRWFYSWVMAVMCGGWDRFGHAPPSYRINHQLIAGLTHLISSKEKSIHPIWITKSCVATERKVVFCTCSCSDRTRPSAFLKTHICICSEKVCLQLKSVLKSEIMLIPCSCHGMISFFPFTPAVFSNSSKRLAIFVAVVPEDIVATATTWAGPCCAEIHTL